MSAPSQASAVPDPVCRQRCFDPVVDRRTSLLILGSLPGEQSLARNEYYGNRQNCFWALMSEVIAQDLTALDYAARLEALLAHGVGLWDVVAEARREGSLDSRIREHADNDLPGLVATLPVLNTIAFNGATAARLGLKVLGPHASGYRIVKLPSSSPAFTLAYGEKARLWQILRAS